MTLAAVAWRRTEINFLRPREKFVHRNNATHTSSTTPQFSAPSRHSAAMGKAVKPKNKSDARKATDPTGGRPKKPAFTQTPQTDAIHKTRILPAMKSLAAASATDRAAALSTICSELLDDDTCRFMLLKERIVAKLMDDMVVDTSDDVVVLAWNALHKIAALEGYDHCVNMFRKGILSKVQPVLEKLALSLEGVAADPSKAPAGVWSLTENIIGLLKCLSEESEQALEGISKINIIVPFLMGLLNPSIPIPEHIQSAAAQCLSSLTEDNDPLNSKILSEQANHIPQLIQLKEHKIPTVRICACAILHNLSLAPTEIENNLTDADLLPVLTSFIKLTATYDLNTFVPSTPDEHAGLRTTEIALEVISSIATFAGYELEDLQHAPKEEPLPEFISEEASDASGDEEMGDDLAELREDMEMTAMSDSEGSGADRMLYYLLESTTPIVVQLSKPTSNERICLRALTALTNIAWTLCNASTLFPRIQTKWTTLAGKIWETIIAPVVTGNTANVALADAITGVAWPLAKSSKQLPTGDIHKSFIGLYGVATSTELKAKCVGVLGALALNEERLDVNRDVGVFFMGVINACPDVPAEVMVETLDAVFDIYADAEYAYDEPVFRALAFVQHLEAGTKGVRALVKRIDKKKFPDLRTKADEASLNLNRFIAYKKKEAKKLEAKDEEMK